MHGWPFAHHLIEGAAAVVATLPTVGAVLAALTPTLLNAVTGVVAGLLLVAVMTLVSRLARPRDSELAGYFLFFLSSFFCLRDARSRACCPQACCAS